MVLRRSIAGSLLRHGPWLAAAAGLVVCLVAWRAEHRLAGAWGLPLDDSWIHCTIARNLAQGHGWSYNPGVPVQNSSGPLWTALVALGFVVAGPTPWVPKLLGVVCLAACILEIARLVRALGGGATAVLAGCLGAALSASFVWHGLSGMETPLAALLATASLRLFYTQRTGWRRFAWVATCALAGMTRPEALVLLPILALERWLGRLDSDAGGPWPARLQAGWRDAALTAGLAILLLAPYFLFNMSLSGSIFPTTFGAKAGGTGLLNAIVHGDAREALVSLTLDAYLWTVLSLGFWSRTHLAAVVLAACGAIALVQRRPRAVAPAATLLLLPLLRGVMAPHVTPEVHEGRYIAVLFPLLFACAGLGLEALLHDRLRLQSPAVMRGSLVVLALAAAALVRLELRVPQIGPGLLGALQTLVPGPPPRALLGPALMQERVGLVVPMLVAAGLLLLRRAGPRAARRTGVTLAALGVGLQTAALAALPGLYARHVRSIDRMDVALGRWVDAHVPPGATIAVNDIGAIAFFGRRPLVDAVGLATPELVPYASPRNLRKLGAMRRMRPSHLVIFPSWFHEWTRRPALVRPVYELRIDDRTILGDDRAVVYATDWDRFARYYPDSLLERLDPPDDDPSLRGRWKRALRNLQVPGRARLYARRADLRRDRDPRQAERDYRRAIGIDPEAGEAWAGLLWLYSKKIPDPTRYAETVEEVARRYPGSSSAQLRLGDLRANQGREDEAAAAYIEALALHPDHIRLLQWQEAYFAARGDAVRAAALRARRQELGPIEPDQAAPPAGAP